MSALLLFYMWRDERRTDVINRPSLHRESTSMKRNERHQKLSVHINLVLFSHHAPPWTEKKTFCFSFVLYFTQRVYISRVAYRIPQLRVLFLSERSLKRETRSFLNPKFVLRLLSPIEIGPLFRGEKPQHQHSRELYLLSFNLRALLSFNLRAFCSL